MLLVLSVYVPRAPEAFCPAPVKKLEITVPAAMPAPVMVWPMAMAPVVIAVTVRMKPEMDPVKVAPTWPPAPMLYWY